MDMHEASAVFEPATGGAGPSLTGASGGVALGAVRERAVRFRLRGRDLILWLALGWLALVCGLAVGAELLPLADQNHISLLARRAQPSPAHLLGTDALGRDILSRLIFGARASLTVGIGSTALGVAVGACLGMLAGYRRGWLEVATIGAMDVLLAFPPLVLALAISAYLGRSVLNLTLTLALLIVPSAARVARAATLSISQRDFVMAAHAAGASHLRILRREVLPNAAAPLLVFFLLTVAVIIVVEGALSFLGLGVPPPLPSWGTMIADGKDSLDLAPHIAFIPAIVMFLTVLSLNLAGDRLQVLSGRRKA